MIFEQACMALLDILDNLRIQREVRNDEAVLAVVSHFCPAQHQSLSPMVLERQV
jgi:hypothetical protein